MKTDLMQMSKESLAATIRRSVRALSLISGAAVIAIALDRNGVPRSWTIVGILVALIALDLGIREHALATLPSAHGPEQFEQLRKRLPTDWLSLGLSYGAAIVGGLEIWRGHATTFSIGILVTFAIAGLLAQFRLKPVLDNAWSRLVDLDSSASSQ